MQKAIVARESTYQTMNTAGLNKLLRQYGKPSLLSKKLYKIIYFLNSSVFERQIMEFHIRHNSLLSAATSRHFYHGLQSIPSVPLEGFLSGLIYIFLSD